MSMHLRIIKNVIPENTLTDRAFLTSSSLKTCNGTGVPTCKAQVAPADPTVITERSAREKPDREPDGLALHKSLTMALELMQE